MQVKHFLLLFFSLCTFLNVPVYAADTPDDDELVCAKGDLYLKLMTDTFVPVDSYDAHIYGDYYTTEPFEDYVIEFNPRILEGVMSANMRVFTKGRGFAEKDGYDRTVIPINNVFEINPRVKGLLIEVSKSFNWGDRYIEYYWINFEDVETVHKKIEPGKISVCLEPLIYD